MFTFEVDSFEWHSQFYSEWKETSKLVNLKISAKVSVSFIKETWENHV